MSGIFSKIQQQMDASHTAMAKKSLWVLLQLALRYDFKGFKQL